MDLSVIQEQGLRVITGNWGGEGWIWLHVDVFNLDSGEYMAHYELQKCLSCGGNGTVFVKMDK